MLILARTFGLILMHIFDSTFSSKNIGKENKKKFGHIFATIPQSKYKLKFLFDRAEFGKKFHETVGDLKIRQWKLSIIANFMFTPIFFKNTNLFKIFIITP